MNKRGQVAIFIIVGVVILGYVIFSYLADNSPPREEPLNKEVLSAEEMSPIRAYFSSCMQEYLDKGIFFAGISEKELNDYLEIKMGECIELASTDNPSFKFTVKYSPVVDTTIYPDNIVYVDVKPNVFVALDDRKSELPDLSLNFILKSQGNLSINGSGVVLQPLSVYSSDNNLKLYIPQNTTVSPQIDKIDIYIQDNDYPGYEPNHNNPSYSAFLSAIVYDINPDGTTFDSPVQLIIAYDEALLVSNQDESALKIVYYDSALDLWFPLVTEVDATNNVLRANISHFSRYAIARAMVDGIESVSDNDWLKYTGVSLSCSTGGKVSTHTCECKGGTNADEKVVDECDQTSCSCDCWGGEEEDDSVAYLKMQCSGVAIPPVNDLKYYEKNDSSYPEPTGVIAYCDLGYTVVNHTCDCDGDQDKNEKFDCGVQNEGDLKGCSTTYTSCDCWGGDDDDPSNTDESIAYLTMYCGTASTTAAIIEAMKFGNPCIGEGPKIGHNWDEEYDPSLFNETVSCIPPSSVGTNCTAGTSQTCNVGTCPGKKLCSAEGVWGTCTKTDPNCDSPLSSMCTSTGGTLKTAGGVQICSFKRETCPEGFSPYYSWSSTNSTIGERNENSFCGGLNYESYTGKQSCKTTNHTWDNKGKESCEYCYLCEDFWTCVQNKTVYSKVVEIGCIR